MSRSLNVLLVDDNDHDRALILRQIEREFGACKVHSVTDAAQLSKTLQAGEFDVVVTDYQLRWSTGIEVLRSVKHNSPDVPVIMFTGTGSEEIAVEAMKFGLDDYIVKGPQHFARLPAAIRSHINQARQRRELEELTRQTERMLRQQSLLFQTMHEAVLLLDREGTIRDANRAAEKTFGVEKQSLVGGLLANRFDPAEAEQLSEAIRNVAAGRGPWSAEIAFFHESSATGECELTLLPIAPTEQDPIRAIAFIHDITRRKQRDREHQRLIAELRERVKEQSLVRQVSDMLQLEDDSLEVVLDKLARLLPEGFQFPELAVARVRVGKGEFCSGPYPERGPSIGFDFSDAPIAFSPDHFPEAVRDRFSVAGRIDVALNEPLPEGATAFLPEERVLIETIRNLLVAFLNRHQIVAALKAGETRYRSLVEASDQLVWVSDAKGEVIGPNDVWTALTGQAIEDAVGWGWLSMLHPDDRERVAANWKDGIVRRRLHQDQFRVRRGDGVYRHVITRAVPVFDERDELVEWIGTLNDVTEQVETEATVRRLAQIVESSEDAIISTTLDGTLASFNRAAEELYGYRAEEVVGRQFSMFMTPDRAEVFNRALNRVAGGEGIPNFDTVHIRKGGTSVTVSLAVSPVKNAAGEIVGAAAIVRDVTSVRYAEESLRLLSRAMASASEGIMICDARQPDTPLVYVTPAFEKMTGYHASEVIGRNPRFLQGADSSPDAVAAMRQAIAQGEKCQVELINYTAEGKPFWCSVTISPVRDDEGQLTHFVGVAQNIDNRKMLELQVQQAQKMEAIGRLAGGVAHDFNNMLTIILGYAEVVRDGLEHDHPSHELLSEIIDAGERAAALTGQLLAFSRRQVLQPKVVDINELVRNVEKMLRRLIGEDVLMTVLLSDELHPAQVDPSQFTQILMNLAVNARDAMPRGGRLTIETANVALGEDYARLHPDVKPGEFVMLAVTDSGLGMTPEVCARIFEPFFTTKEHGRGSGMGLATVFGIVKQSNGHIAVYSEPGKGSTFKIYLPQVHSPYVRPAAGDRFRKIAFPGGKETILLVEDEAAVRELAVVVLRSVGYRVLAADGPQAAIEISTAHEGPIDLLLSDVIMPGMSGPELAETLRPLRLEMKILFISGYTDNTIGIHGVLEQAMAFLQKPFTRESLVVKVRQVLDEPAVSVYEE